MEENATYFLDASLQNKLFWKMKGLAMFVALVSGENFVFLCFKHDAEKMRNWTFSVKMLKVELNW